MGKVFNFFLLLHALGFMLCVLYSPAAYADDNPLNRMRDETLSYFEPVTGKITKVENKKVVVDLGTKDAVKVGMRFNILREESHFKHPVTKEPLGKLESQIGRLEIKEVRPGSSVGYLIEGDAKKDDKVRISGIKLNMLFCQSKGIDWYLSDSYYRSLKETGRFNMIDTAIETDDPEKILEEAKRLKAEVALSLTAKTEDTNTILKQSLFWVSDGIKFFEGDTKVDIAYAKEMRFGEEFFALHQGDALLKFDLPFDMRFISIGDVNGDGEHEIILSTGEDVGVYMLNVDLNPALGGVKIKGSGMDEHLWLDSIDLNRNGRDEIIITSMRGDEVTSYIYELSNTGFVLLNKDNVFMRRIENRLIAQEYSSAEGFDGKVFEILWEGEYKRGSEIKLPKGVNIYDFIYIDDPQKGKLVLAYDEKGFLDVYDDNNIKMWSSKTNTGDFLTTFKKSAPSVMVDRGEWAVKDRLTPRKKEVLFVQRVPLFGYLKGIGYKSSQIKSLWWNGLSMDESVLMDEISGSILDYVVTGEKVIILVSPILGIKPGNILKGESPLRTMLYIYSIKGNL